MDIISCNKPKKYLLRLLKPKDGKASAQYKFPIVKNKRVETDNRLVTVI